MARKGIGKNLKEMRSQSFPFPLFMFEYHMQGKWYLRGKVFISASTYKLCDLNDLFYYFGSKGTRKQNKSHGSSFDPN